MVFVIVLALALAAVGIHAAVSFALRCASRAVSAAGDAPGAERCRAAIDGMARASAAHDTRTGVAGAVILSILADSARASSLSSR